MKVMVTFNRDLVDDCARRKVIVFVGSGVSAGVKTRSGQHMRDWEGFLRHAAGLINSTIDKKIVEELLLSKDYIMACEIIKSSLDENSWNNLVYEEFSKVGLVSDLHKSIASLDQRITLTTNFDKLLESTFQDASTGTHYPITISNLSEEVFHILRDDKKYIIKIHGTVDSPTSMIFAKTDYAKKAFSNWAYSEFIGTLLVSYTFLFVGFSMNDPAISLLVERYAQKFPNARPHYILQPSPINSRFRDVSKNLRKLYVIEYDPIDNHKNLALTIDALAEVTVARRREILAEELRAMR
ncbi:MULTISPECIES: SIR2 family protein [unclassified Sphingomonas]|uniref:SIR2 family protein n=1 Tax=unclassified Sphingomonas TaxID=196159 RepID=UPI0009E7F101|nr:MULTISPECIES: SIR2 family protein [unclassified Sphingomonas]